jgi:hypothetical protein
MCQEAERLGTDSVWFSEHYRFEDGYLPQPLTFRGSVAGMPADIVARHVETICTRLRPLKVGVWFDLRNPPGWRQEADLARPCLRRLVSHVP